MEDTKMTAPTVKWPGFDGLDPESIQYKRISRVLKEANFEFLSNKALSVRQALSPTTKASSCIVDTEKFTYGYRNIVFQLRFCDPVCWVARVTLPSKSFDDRVMEEELYSEITTIQLVKERTTIPIPEVFAYEIKAKNEFGFRYMLMEAIPGQPLTRGLARLVPEEFMEKVSRQIGEIYFQLSTIRFDKIGRLTKKGEDIEVTSFHLWSYDKATAPLATSLEYFYLSLQERNRAALRHRSTDYTKEFETASWVLSQSLPNIVLEKAIYGPFPLCHVDLHHGNILFNERWEITGIIDWTGAQTVPWEHLALDPEGITFPGVSQDVNERIVSYREQVAAVIAERQRDTGVHSPLPELMGSQSAEITYRCILSKPWRALTDARLLVGLIYGSAVTFDDLVALRKVAAKPPLFGHRQRTGVLAKLFDLFRVFL
jgi:isoamyl acetate esterase